MSHNNYLKNKYQNTYTDDEISDIIANYNRLKKKASTEKDLILYITKQVTDLTKKYEENEKRASVLLDKLDILMDYIEMVKPKDNK